VPISATQPFRMSTDDQQLSDVAVLELTIVPDISGGSARASLKKIWKARPPRSPRLLHPASLSGKQAGHEPWNERSHSRQPPGGDAAAEQAGRIYYQRELDQMVRDIERNVDRSALQRGRALFSLS